MSLIRLARPDPLVRLNKNHLGKGEHGGQFAKKTGVDAKAPKGAWTMSATLLPPDDLKTLRELYVRSPNSFTINSYLREGPAVGEGIAATAAEQVPQLDGIFERDTKPFTEPIRAYRATTDPSEDMGLAANPADLPGTRFTDRGYFSTTANREDAVNWADTVWDLTIEPGVRGIKVPDDTYQHELVLERGLEVEVTSVTAAQPPWDPEKYVGATIHATVRKP